MEEQARREVLGEDTRVAVFESTLGIEMEVQARSAATRESLAAAEPLVAGAGEAAPLSLEELVAALDPWRWPVPDAAGSYFGSLLALPRQFQSDTSRDAVWPALIVGFVLWSLCLSMIAIVLGLLVPGADSPLDAIAKLSHSMGSAGGTILTLLGGGIGGSMLWLPREMYISHRDGLIRRWEDMYRHTYWTLCTTGLAAQIVDPEFWRAALSNAPANALLKYVGLGPPKSPEEAVRLAAAFWPYLLRYQAGDAKALAAGIYEGYGRFAVAGTRLESKETHERFDLRACAAAITDFLRNPPELSMPPT